jgi:hypothetical protein
MQGRNVGEQQIERIKQASIDGTTMKALSIELGLTTDCLAIHAKRLGITLQRARKPLTENVNHYFFDVWSPEMAYVLGYICADGNIQHKKQGGKLISFAVGAKDKDYLQQIADLMDLRLPLRPYTNKKTGISTYHVCASSPILYDRLVELGVHERKSWDMQWLSSIPKNLISHFVRGYFDGDGDIHIRIRHDRKEAKQLRMRIVGREDFLRGVKTHFNAVIGREIGSMSPHSTSEGHFELAYWGNKTALAFAAWMYDQSTPQTRLDRKYQVYQDFLNTRNVL